MSKNDFYFSKFENRQPPEPLPYSAVREVLWQICVSLALILGVRYLYWRWAYSLNLDALWLAIPLVVAETLAFIGLVLFVFNLWRTEDTPSDAPPHRMHECDPEFEGDRPVAVDIFFTTYNESPELVRLGLQDAKKIQYPHHITTTIYVLDDGRREEMRAVADEENVHYISREDNAGFKAGNLRHAMLMTNGDFIVICDADTRPFPTILEHTLGYFRDPRVAWVQTPQWFYDIPKGQSLPCYLSRYLGSVGRLFGKAIEKVIGPLLIGHDPLANDPQMFYDIILRRRNWANAVFCCGAGSIHRREAIMETALKNYGSEVTSTLAQSVKALKRRTRATQVSDIVLDAMRGETVLNTEFTPYKLHVSEDIYTSLVLHADQDREWHSVLHPQVESKMLSPQDLLSWTVQRYKYAGGSLDIFLHDNFLFKKGLKLRQKLMYAVTYYSYLGGIWNVLFLIAPILYFFTALSPVSSISIDFFAHFLPFLVTLEFAMLLGTWGVPSYQSRSSYLSFFYVNLQALFSVLKGEQVKFHVTPKDRQAGRHFRLVWPHLIIVLLTLGGIAYSVFAYQHAIGGYTLLGIVCNTFWGLSNVMALFPILRTAIFDIET